MLYNTLTFGLCYRVRRLLDRVQRDDRHRLLPTRPQRTHLRRSLLPEGSHKAGDQATPTAEDLQPLRPGGQVPRVFRLRHRRHRTRRDHPRLRRRHSTSTLVSEHQVPRQAAPSQASHRDDQPRRHVAAEHHFPRAQRLHTHDEDCSPGQGEASGDDLFFLEPSQ